MGSIAVSKNGQLIYTRSLGLADVASQRAATEASRYRIGSISKTFTAVLVFKAIEQKKLSLQQSIDRFFPTLPHAGKITVAHLLAHRSGIHNFTNDSTYLTWNTQPKTEADMIGLITAGGSDFEPGTKAAYSNSNYVLLTYLLQQVFKQPYAQLLQTHIAGPAKLSATYLGKAIDPAKNECRSYRFDGQWQAEPETDPSIPLGAGAIVSTPSDLVRFSDALFGGQLLRPESLAQMQTLQDNYGKGLFRIPFNDHAGFGHTGGIDGFSSVFIHFADSSVSYALTSNGTRMNNNDITLAVLAAVYGLPYRIPDFSAYQPTPAELEQYAGTYSAPGFPLKITITQQDGQLMAQATGQQAFPLEPDGKHRFGFDAAGIVLEFDPAAQTMVLVQAGRKFKLSKEK